MKSWLLTVIKNIMAPIGRIRGIAMEKNKVKVKAAIATVFLYPMS
jgi:hypothetical protein